MAIKKSDLYSSLWKSCDELRGGMDASQYKDYILTLLFLKYVSDKAEADADSLIEVPDGCSFDDIVALRNTKEIGEGIDKIVAELATENELRGVIDVTSFNDDAKLGKGPAMVARLSKLVAIFDGLDFRASRADGDDLLGDAYEYLMRHFATESGKSKGQFYTPAEVSRILAKVVGIGEEAHQSQTIYDPTCGSGSLLLKAADETPHGLTVYGQEKDVATWALARMNMILHGYETAEICRDDVIASPGFTRGGELKLHDFVVANPPFSTKSWSSGISPEADEFKRFNGLGIPPARNGDYAFLLHAVKSLKSTGKAAVIMPHGVLFRGGAEATIRRELLKRGLIKGVIGLPPNLFYGTSISACVVVIDKEGAEDRKEVFLIDGARGCIKEGAKNRLRAQDIHKIVDVFTRQVEVERYSRLVPLEEIASEANDFNLNLPRYIDSSDPEDIQDLDAHLNGGIPDRDLDLLSKYWEALPSMRKQLFEPERPGYSRARVEPSAVQRTIETNPDFQRLRQEVTDTLSTWWADHREQLGCFEEGASPKSNINELSESLLQRFKDVPLLESYEVYEQLMRYWEATMQDDLYLISAEGWMEAAKPRGVREVGKTDKGKPRYEEADLVVGSGQSAKKYKMDLLPPELIVGRYFAAENEALDRRQVELDRAVQALEAYVEEQSGDDGALEGVANEKGNVVKKALTDQIKELNEQPELGDELAVTERCRELLESETGAKRAVKDSERELCEKVVTKYQELADDDVQLLVVEGKWRASIETAIEHEISRAAHSLIGRVQVLEDRYTDTLARLDAECSDLQRRVIEHLHAMGFS